MFRLSLRRSSPRCAYCHEVLEAGLACAACHTAFHADCRAELAHCPTLGCGCDALLTLGGKLLAPSRKAIERFLADVRNQTIAETVVGLLLCFLLTAFLSFIALSETSTRKGYRTPPNPAAAGMVCILATVAGTGLVVVQVRHVRAVTRLLEAGAMREATLRITSKKQSVKGGTITIFEGRVREKGFPEMTLALGSSPTWLGPWMIEHEIGIYSGNAFEPVILCHGEDLRVVRPMKVRRA
ncbi:MAG TPA: hypothetical protein VFF73_16620 [Planctomycetota bacterium]|nr:hypothetical protein [Planctomycetota bacterium]